jgi:hypothetical protein
MMREPPAKLSFEIVSIEEAACPIDMFGPSFRPTSSANRFKSLALLGSLTTQKNHSFAKGSTVN